MPPRTPPTAPLSAPLAAAQAFVAQMIDAAAAAYVAVPWLRRLVLGAAIGTGGFVLLAGVLAFGQRRAAAPSAAAAAASAATKKTQ